MTAGFNFNSRVSGTVHAGSLHRNEATVILVTNIFAFYTMKSQFY